MKLHPASDFTASGPSPRSAHALLAAFLVLSGAVFSAASCGPETVREETCASVLTFPASPSRRTYPVATGFRGSTPGVLQHVHADGVYFQYRCEYRFLPDELDRGEIYERALQSRLRVYDAEISDRTPINLNGAPGLRAVFRGFEDARPPLQRKEIRGRIQVIHRDQRIHILMTFNKDPDSASDTENAERDQAMLDFLDSFSFSKEDA